MVQYTFREGRGVGPFELFCAALLTISGAASIFGDVPQSVQKVLVSHIIRDVWAGMYVLGGILTITGLFWVGKRLTAYTFEQIGVLLFSAASLIYVVALMSVDDRSSTQVAASYVIGFGVASLARAIKLTRLKNELLAITRGLNGSRE